MDQTRSGSNLSKKITLGNWCIAFTFISTAALQAAPPGGLTTAHRGQDRGKTGSYYLKGR